MRGRRWRRDTLGELDEEGASEGGGAVEGGDGGLGVVPLVELHVAKAPRPVRVVAPGNVHVSDLDALGHHFDLNLKLIKKNYIKSDRKEPYAPVAAEKVP